MKEYKTDLMKTSWNYGRILLIPVLVALDYVMTITMGKSVLPLWLDSIGVLIASCIGGPVFGAVVAVVQTIVELITIGGLVVFVEGTAMLAAAVFFGTYVRLGFFGNLKGVFVGAVAVVFVDTCIRMPANMALFGTFRTNNIMIKAIIDLLDGTHMAPPFVSAIAFMAADIIDRIVVLLIIYFVVTHIPAKIAKVFLATEGLPVYTVVDSASEEEFLSESDRLKAQAKEKLEKQKAEDKATDTEAKK